MYQLVCPYETKACCAHVKGSFVKLWCNLLRFNVSCTLDAFVAKFLRLFVGEASCESSTNYLQGTIEPNTYVGSATFASTKLVVVRKFVSSLVP